MALARDLDRCGCCAGVDSETPVKLSNRPSQTTISYRIGTHSKFKESMLAALSKAKYPALLPLGTRDDDDFTIAYLDGVATMLDVLTFYQERYVNEHYLTTSSERRSVLEMAQLIGYQLSPGVAAATHLAFTLQATPGAAASALEAIKIPRGTRVQSVPGQDETPQIFETEEDIEARAHWNAVAVQTTIPYGPEVGDLDIYVDGVNNILAPGDAILIVGQERMENTDSDRWEVRVVRQVVKDTENLRTRLVWARPLDRFPIIQPGDSNIRLFVFRKRASLFGHNAPDTQFFVSNLGANSNELMANFESEDPGIQDNHIDLASREEKILTDSWVALVSKIGVLGSADLHGDVELYRAEKVLAISRTDFGISSKITRINLEGDNSEKPESAPVATFDVQKTLALVVSEELTIHARPLHYPLFSNTIKLEEHIDGLVPDQYLSISGQRQRLKVAPGITNLQLQGEAGSRELNEGDSVQLIAIPEKLSGGTPDPLSPEEFGELIDSNDSSTELRLRISDRDGSTGTVECWGSDWLWDCNADDPLVSEIGQIDSGDGDVDNNRDRTTIKLTTALGNIYHRDSVRINFNVAPANHGETVVEILGDGDARKTDQSFVLKHQPLTHVSADTPSGGSAELELRVNELLWHEVASLYQADSDARVYKIQNRDDGATAVCFGDGIEGGRLPTGQTNVRAIYRKYLGAAANLNSGKLTTLLQNPLGVTAVTNPEAATGGADPEVIADAKQNAPLTVLTLDRAVSVLDYQHYARAFAGVAKAHALWIHAGPSKGIYITLAGAAGAEIPATSKTYTNLMNSLRRYGDPNLPLNLVNYKQATFALGMAVKVHAEAINSVVLAALESALRDHFSFANRDFGQFVSQDEVLAVAHQVKDVEAVRITRLYKQQPAAVDSIAPIIGAHLPVASLKHAPQPAELLTLSKDPIEMGSFS